MGRLDAAEALDEKISSKCAAEFPGAPLVLGQGPVPCALMVIGEAPGREEARQGVSFVGRSGTFLMDAIRQATGLGRGSFYLTNVVKVWPRSGSGRLRTRKPTRREMAIFKPLLMDEIGIVSPEVVLAVGRTAFEALSPEAEFIAGRWAECGKTPVMPIYHPAYLLRRLRSLDRSSRELARALEEVRLRLGL